MIELRCRKCGVIGRMERVDARYNYCPKCGKWLLLRCIE